MDSEFQKYYVEYQTLVFYTALGILKNQEAAEDIMNDVFATLYEYMSSGRPPVRKIRGWLIVTAKRRAYNYIRDNKRLVPISWDLAAEDSRGHAENRVFASDILNDLYRHNKKWFDVMDKHYMLEMSTKEIAEEYRCSEQAIRNILHRALVYLRKKYKITDMFFLLFLILHIFLQS